MGIVFLYGTDVFKEAAIGRICSVQGLTLKHIHARETDVPFRVFFTGTADTETFAGEPLNTEIMVMALETRAALDTFLDALRDAGIWVPLKAVVTPTNINWTLRELAFEITKEHRTMTTGMSGGKEGKKDE